MKIIIKENGAVHLMKEYLKKNFPTLLEPLLMILGDGRNYFCDKFDTVWITEFDDSTRNSAKYEVDDRLETMYDLFGQELFELFFLEVHGIDLKNKGNKNLDWVLA